MRIGLRLVRIVALTLAVAFLATTAAMPSELRAESSAAAHHDGARCPDPGPDSASCGADCICACCPGQAPVATPGESGIGPAARTTCGRHAPADEGLRSDGPGRSIFHPPRRLAPA